jgi:transcription initiation factor IIE alpha subunit
MEALRIEILNPKVKIILKQLAELKLISISKAETHEQKLEKLLEQMRAEEPPAPTLEEISKEVKVVRKQRYARMC